jgi:hypothetical protein
MVIPHSASGLIFSSRILEPGVKKALDPRSGTATLQWTPATEETHCYYPTDLKEAYNEDRINEYNLERMTVFKILLL